MKEQKFFKYINVFSLGLRIKLGLNVLFEIAGGFILLSLIENKFHT